MPVKIERGTSEQGTQIVRTVVDTEDKCNLRCPYCDNFNPKLKGKHLPVQQIEDILQTANKQNQLDVVLSGGEIMTHPDFDGIVNATHVLDRTGTTLITNGTLLTPKRVSQIRDSRISRICISLDGPTKDTHEYGRGRETFERAMRGLQMLQDSGKNIAVLTVIHQGNIDHALELSELLVKSHLANQHHFAAMYFSGRARENWQNFYLPLKAIYDFQDRLDEVFEEYKRQGLYLLFNHFWPITGQRPKAGNPREMLSHQLGEQNKATWAVVRSNGDVNSTTAYWGRQSVDNPVIGNLNEERAEDVFNRLDTLYRSGRLYQLPREIEAARKFIVGDFNQMAANAILSNEKGDIELVPCRPMSELDIMQKPIEQKYLDEMVKLYLASPNSYRIVQHATGVYLFYDNTTAHVILLNETELSQFTSIIESRKSLISV